MGLLMNEYTVIRLSDTLLVAIYLLDFFFAILQVAVINMNLYFCPPMEVFPIK